MYKLQINYTKSCISIYLFCFDKSRRRTYLLARIYSLHVIYSRFDTNHQHIHANKMKYFDKKISKYTVKPRTILNRNFIPI